MRVDEHQDASTTLLAQHGTRPRLRDLQAGGGVDPGLVLERVRAQDASTPALQDTNDHFLANIQRDGTYSVVPRVPGGEITPDKLIAIGAGRQEVRPVHQDHRRPAHRPVRRARRAAAADLGGADRRRLRVRPRLRQGAAHGEELRRHRPGAATACRTRVGLAIRHREPLQGPARAAQAQVRRVGLHARVRRGAGQGLRHHRHREGLEPLRLRQRRHEAAPRRPARRRPRRRRR